MSGDAINPEEPIEVYVMSEEEVATMQAHWCKCFFVKSLDVVHWKCPTCCQMVPFMPLAQVHLLPVLAAGEVKHLGYSPVRGFIASICGNCGHTNWYDAATVGIGPEAEAYEKKPPDPKVEGQL